MALNIDRAESIRGVASVKDDAEIGQVQCVETKAEGRTSENTTILERKSFWQQLALYNGTFTDKSLFPMILASFAIACNLIASYNVFVSGLIMAWFVAMSVLAGVMFAAPPWTYDSAAIGYISVGPLVGGAIATIVIAWACDPIIKSMARRNAGVYEPEFRLPLAVLGCVFSVAGLVSFGHAIENSISIYAISTIWGLTLFGMSIVASVTMAYALDAQPAHAVEMFILNITFKNFFFYGLTNYIVEWYLKTGPASLFDTVAGITAFLVLLTIPMYAYGKRYRLYWSRNNLLVRWKLEENPAVSH